LLAEDHRLVRAGLRALLESLPGFEVVGEATDGADAIERVRQLAPDVVLMDISMPQQNGLEAMRRIRKSSPATRVLVVSMHAERPYVEEALAAGAAGYLLKNADRAELELALAVVARGDLWLSPAVSRTIVEALLERTTQPPRGAERLTPRQRQILQLIADGNSTKQIAQALHISAKTVDAHRAEIMVRLDVHNVAGLVNYAIRHGIVPPHKTRGA
jgi:DNA-binding NarL/FixJ family response regulator